jgi:hypothetical protein
MKRNVLVNKRKERDATTCKSLIETIASNVDNKKLSDSDFRNFVRNSLPVTEVEVDAELEKGRLTRWEKNIPCDYGSCRRTTNCAGPCDDYNTWLAKRPKS